MLGETDAVTLPLKIRDASKSDIAAAGISNRFLPLPLKDEPDIIDTDPDILKLPVNWEPLWDDSTLNPKLGVTDAVTEPLAILNNSNDNADCGISNNNLPLPLNAEPLLASILPPVINKEPVNWEPNSADITLNPS